MRQERGKGITLVPLEKERSTLLVSHNSKGRGRGSGGLGRFVEGWGRGKNWGVEERSRIKASKERVSPKERKENFIPPMDGKRRRRGRIGPFRPHFDEKTIRITRVQPVGKGQKVLANCLRVGGEEAASRHRI